MKKEQPFQQIVLEQSDVCMQRKKKKNVNLNLIFYTNINSKWVTGLTVKPKTMKIFKEQKQRKSPGTNHRVLSLDTKSITCKRKRWWIGPYQP